MSKFFFVKLENFFIPEIKYMFKKPVYSTWLPNFPYRCGETRGLFDQCVLARYRFEYCASWASPKKLARHWSLGPSLEMSPKFGKLASTSPCKWSIFKLIHYFFPFPCFIYLHLIQFYVRLNKITFLYVSIIENIRSKAL